MVFMNFIMPSMLITCINSMDEVKRLLIEKANKIQLTGINNLFPREEMNEQYQCYQLPQTELELLSNAIEFEPESSHIKGIRPTWSQEEGQQVFRALDAQQGTIKGRKLLQQGFVIEIDTDKRIPVDCILLKGTTIVDASLLTGEPYQKKDLWQFIPAGAMNKGAKITVYAAKNPYHSTINALLFRANRAKSAENKEELPKFAYLYTALILLGLIGSISIPFALGIATIPLLIQNVMGILFSLCPCTIAIAHQLPQLISIYHRNRKGIHLHDERMSVAEADDAHTVVFDKTGTLTTGNAKVHSADIPPSLWTRIYLLEKTCDPKHPLARAIQNHYEENVQNRSLIDQVTDVIKDPKSRGWSAQVQGKKVYIGNAEYLTEHGIPLPELDQAKIEQGLSPVYVAEKDYCGVIYVEHEVRPGIIAALNKLKQQGKKIILLTGDTPESAQAFNKQIGSIFDKQDIFARQTPQKKEEFFTTKIFAEQNINPKGVWFVGDGLNDAPCCRLVSENGGISFAMDKEDKSTFFTDITLNGSLEYLFHHNKLNQSLQHHITQNKSILIYSTLAFLAFIISFSIAGIAVPALIPMATMVSTTFFVLFNSYRTQLTIDTVLDKECTRYKKLLSSDFSPGLLITASTLLIAATLIATIATGGLSLPIFAFTAGVAMTCSSICTLTAAALMAVFTGIFSASFWSARPVPEPDKTRLSECLRATSAPIENSPKEHIPRFSLCSVQDKNKGSIKRTEATVAPHATPGVRVS